MSLSWSNNENHTCVRRIIMVVNKQENWYEVDSKQTFQKLFPQYDLFYDLRKGEWIDRTKRIEDYCQKEQLPYVEAMTLLDV